MPTTRPRHLVTESDALAEALDDAAERWPGVSRAKLLVRLALEGHQAVVSQAELRLQQRREKIRAHAGAATGCYGPGYLEDLRSEWPE